MVKFLTTALGGLTALTVAGLATPSGQAMLGLHRAQPVIPISVISDPGPVKVALPAVTPVGTAPAPAPEAAPAPAVVQHTAVPAPRPDPVAHPAATHPVYHPAASRPVYHSGPAQAPASVPMGGAGAGAITNILLNLPQVLQQGGAPGVPQYAPAAPVPNNGGWVPPGQRHRSDRWRHGQGDEHRDSGEQH